MVTIIFISVTRQKHRLEVVRINSALISLTYDSVFMGQHNELGAVTFGAILLLARDSDSR